jgi:hypothetical protein
MENLNRVGSLGMFGEALNGMVNVGTGTDNRVINPDQRIVALSAFLSLNSIVSNAINQGGIDYAHVVRPLAAAMGGNGLLQYMQLANHTMGLDNPESRAVARTNAQNWLRAAGRELEMDVRETGGGAGGAPNITTVSPHLTKMELSAYGNDAAGFREAYTDAVQAAKQQGQPDPVDYVKRAFTARNPLKRVFQTPPSAAEYRRLLSFMPDTGATDVRQAVDLFNHFAESIGAKGFEGKQETAPKLNLTAPSLPNLSQYRMRAASLMLQ